MIKKFIGIGILAVIGLIVAYGAIVIYGNIKALNQDDYSMPDNSEAHYAVRIASTGNYLLTNNVEEDGDIITLHGYWELVDEEFEYRNHDIALDKAVFGKIEVRKR